MNVGMYKYIYIYICMYVCFYVCKSVLILKILTLRDSAIPHFNITGIRSIWVELQLWECSISTIF